MNTPTPPVPEPIYPYTTIGICPTCWQMVTLVQPVFPQEPLGKEFDAVLFGNLWDLYAR